VPAVNDILTVAEVAEPLKYKPSSVYNLTRRRGRARYDNPIPALRLPMGAVPSVVRSRVAEVARDNERSVGFRFHSQ